MTGLPPFYPKEYGVDLYGRLLLAALETVQVASLREVKRFAAELLACIGRWPRRTVALNNSTALARILVRIVSGDPLAVRSLHIDRGVLIAFLESWLAKFQASPVHRLVSDLLHEALKIRAAVAHDMLPTVRLYSRKYWARNRALAPADIAHSLLTIAIRSIDSTDVTRATVYSRVTTVLSYSDMISPRVFRNGDAYSVPAHVWRDWRYGDGIGNLNQSSQILSSMAETIPISPDQDDPTAKRITQLRKLAVWVPSVSRLLNA